MDGTFKPDLPTSRDRLRAALGDTSRPFDLADATIDTVLADQGGKLRPSAAVLADMLATLYAKRAFEVQQGPIRKKFIDRSAYFEKLALRFTNHGFPGETDPNVQVETGMAVGQLTAPTLEGYRPF